MEKGSKIAPKLESIIVNLASVTRSCQIRVLTKPFTTTAFCLSQLKLIGFNTA